MKDFKYLKDVFSKINLQVSGKKTNDFNFFSPYIAKKKNTHDRHVISIISVAVLLFIFAGSFLWNFIKINRTEKEINQMKKAISSSTTQARLREADTLSKKHDILVKYYNQVSNISNEINKKQLVSSDLMGKISSTLPQSVSLKTMSIDSQGIELQGTAGSRVNIGELQYNLKQLDVIKDVQVISINEALSNGQNGTNNGTTVTSNGFTFTLKCTLKDVEVNEN
jgi:type IV pilus assembly protein PilN